VAFDPGKLRDEVRGMVKLKNRSEKITHLKKRRRPIQFGKEGRWGRSYLATQVRRGRRRPEAKEFFREGRKKTER